MLRDVMLSNQCINQIVVALLQIRIILKLRGWLVVRGD